jgi:hypothetical protein
LVKKIAIFLAVLFGFVGMLVIGVLLWVTSDSGSKTLSEKIKTWVHDGAGIDVSFEKVGIHLFPPRISVSQIKSRDPSGRFSCLVDEAELSPDFGALLTGNLAVEEVYLGEPNCDVSLKSADIDLLLKNDQPKKTKAFDYKAVPKFDVLAVSNASLNLTVEDKDRLGALTVGLSGFGLDITSDEEGIEIRGLLKQAAGKWQKGEKKAQEKMSGLEFRAALNQAGVEIRYLSTDIADIEIRLRDARIPIPLWPKGLEAADLSVHVPLESINRIPLGLPELRGSASFSGRVGASKNKDGDIGLSSKGRVELLDIEAGDFVIGSIMSKIAVSPRDVAFSETEISTAEGNIRLAGNVLLSSNLPIEANLDLNNIELGRLLEQVTVGGSYVTQYMTGPIHLKGSLNPLRLGGNIKIDVRDHTTRTGSFRTRDFMTAIHIPRAFVTGPVFITDTSFEGKNLSVKSGSTKLNVSLAFDFPNFSWWLKATSQDLYLEDVDTILGMKVGGHGPVRCSIEGPINDPNINGQGNFQGAKLGDMEFDRASTEVNFHDLTLSFDGLKIARKTSRISADSLNFDFTKPRGIDVDTKINVEHAAAETLMEIFHIDDKRWGSPTGLLFGRMALHYSTDPERLIVSADLVHENMQVFGERFGPDVLRVDWNNGELVVNELGLTKGQGTIYVTGAMRPDGTMSFVGNVNRVNLSAVDNPAVQKLEADGPVTAFVVVEGTLARPTGTIDIELGKTERLGETFGPSQISVHLDGDRLKGDGSFFGGVIRLEHLMLDLKANRFQVESFVDGLDAVPLIASSSMPKGASLKLTGDLALEGRIDSTPDISGHAELMRVDMNLSDFHFENKTPLNVVAKNDRFDIQDTRFFGPDVVFDFGGSVSLDKMNLAVKGLADLRSASQMTFGITKTEGKLRFEIAASGPVTAPSFLGTAAIENGFVRTAGFPLDITGIKGNISVSPKIIRFQDFEADASRGRLSLNGEIELAGGRISTYGFQLKAENVELAPFKDLTLRASTSRDGLLLTSPRPGKLPNITGDINIDSLRYTADIRIFELQDISVDRLSGARISAKKTKIIDPAKDFFSFDIRLHGRDDIEAHNNLFDVKLSIDDREKPLRILGTNQTFGFQGRVLGNEGKVRFAGRRFDIRYAALDFQDADRPDNPYFQVISEGAVRDWNVTLTAEGTVDEYELKFSSQPYLSKEDIAFLILTGLTQAENRQFNRGVNLGMPLIGQLGPGGGALPVELQVYSKYSDTAGKDTTRIAMGRWINEDIWVSISSAVAQTRDVEAHVDYKINDDVSVSGSYEEDDERTGNVGLDLKFRLEF